MDSFIPVTHFHSVGGVEGLIHDRNFRFNFLSTPALFDGLFLDRIDKGQKVKFSVVVFTNA